MIRASTLAIIVAAGAFASCDVPDVSFYPLSGNCAGSDPGPVLCISTPLPDGTVTEFTGNGTFEVIAAVGNFTLRQPGDCHRVDNTCGHLHIFVDEGTCPQMPPAAYLISSDTRIHVSLGSCAVLPGPHTVKIELHNDVHGDITPNPVFVRTTFVAAPM